MSKENRPVRPWDMFLTKERVIEEIKEKRLSICASGCPNYIKLTKQCIKCGCFLHAKAALPDAECPIGKWGPSTDHEEYSLPGAASVRSVQVDEVPADVRKEPAKTKNNMSSFYHLHIPKTGGHYIRSRISVDLEETFKVNGITHVVDHAGWEHIKDDTYVLTSLRDPAERTVSHFVHYSTPHDNTNLEYVKSLTVEELFNWIELNLDYISNYQSKNFLYIKEPGRQVSRFFFDDPSFRRLSVDKELLYSRLKRVNLMVRNSQLNNESTRAMRDEILSDFGLPLVSTDKKPLYFENVNDLSRELYEKLTKEQKDYLYSINDVDSEIYNTDSLFWNNGQ